MKLQPALLLDIPKYTLYIVPLTLVLAVPIVIAFLRDERSTIVGTDEKRFWIAIELVWICLWICRAVAYVLPKVAQKFCAHPSLGKTRCSYLLERLVNPISLVLWMLLNQFTFVLLVNTDRTWRRTVQSILKALLVCSCLFLFKQLAIQTIRMSHDHRMAENKSEWSDLISLYTMAGRMPGKGGDRSARCLGGELHDEESESSTVWGGLHAEQELKSALENMDSTKRLAAHVYESLCKDPSSVALCKAPRDVLTCPGEGQICTSCLLDRIRCMFLPACAADVHRAINELNSLLSIAVLITCSIVFVMFLSPNLLSALATSATALLSLSFVFATTCQEVLGSCVFLFIKHPYDVGNSVIIGDSELVVEHISLLFTVFTRAQTAKVVQIPNIVLNTLWVDNTSRSKTIKAQVPVFVAVQRAPEALSALAAGLQTFRNNIRDVQTKVNITAVSEMEMLELQCELHYQPKRPGAGLCASLRAKFTDAVVTALSEASHERPLAGTASAVKVV